MKNKRSNKYKFYKLLSFVLIIVSIILTGELLYLDLLPTKYISIIIGFIVIFDLFSILLLNSRRLKAKVRKVLTFLVVIVIFGMSVLNFYFGKTLEVLIGNGDSKYRIENYSIIVLNNSKMENLKDIKNEEVGYYESSTGSNLAIEHINKKVNVDFKQYKDSNNLANDLLDSNIEVVLIEDSILNILKEENDDFSSKIKEIYKFTIKVEVESTLKDIDVTKKPFVIYISGIDTYGEINSSSRSDVNILAVVNTNTKQILLISIPRDYYVQLHGTSGAKDKLTHAGIYGIDMSIKTIEDLLDVKINYYLKVNFTSVIDIVDALGKLDVYSDYTFLSYSGYSFKKGYNSVNGEQALDFVRTRKAFSDGDRQRGKNQQALIDAIIKKATTKSIITKYSSLLDAIDGKYQTNMSMKKITSLIKMQLNDMSNWTVTSYSLSGIDSNNYTYTYNQLLYVMEPDIKSITEAKGLISSILNGEELEGSYSEQYGGSNTVTKVPVEQNTSKDLPKDSSKENEYQNKKEESITDQEKENTEDDKDSDKENSSNENDRADDKTDEESKPSEEIKDDNSNITDDDNSDILLPSDNN